MSIAEIKAMSSAERLEVMELLWDSITHESAEPRSPKWYEGVLDERRKRIEEAKFHTIEEAQEIVNNA